MVPIPGRMRLLATLRRYDVTVVIGSDQFRRTAAFEAEALAEFGVFDNLQLLTMWSVDTPRMIFPNRKIGYFRDGYEASFLVLDDNSLDDFRNAQRIVLRVKQGRTIAPNRGVPAGTRRIALRRGKRRPHLYHTGSRKSDSVQAGREVLEPAVARQECG